MKKKIYYHDTDCGGVVYYANYLKYLEEARTEFLQERGISMKELADDGVLFVVAHQGIDYKSPAFYGDILDISVRLCRIHVARLEYAHEVKNQNGKLICVAETTLVCVSSDFRPKAVPEELKSRLTS
jgi:acyl-CoA thioester hydrolase